MFKRTLAGGWDGATPVTLGTVHGLSLDGLTSMPVMVTIEAWAPSSCDVSRTAIR